MHPQHSGYFAVTAEAAPPQTVGESMLHYVCKHCSLWVCVYNLRFEVAFAYQLRSVTNDLWHIYVSCPSIRSFAYAFLYRFSGRMNRKGRINHIVFSIVLYVWFSKQMHRRERKRASERKKNSAFCVGKSVQIFSFSLGCKSGNFYVLVLPKCKHVRYLLWYLIPFEAFNWCKTTSKRTTFYAKSFRSIHTNNTYDYISHSSILDTMCVHISLGDDEYSSWPTIEQL